MSLSYGNAEGAKPQDGILGKSIRDDFPILAQMVHGDRPLVYLDNAASTQRPRQVIDAIRRTYEQDYANVYRGIHVLSERASLQYEEARRTVQRFLNAAEPEEVIFTQGATMAINTVARSWGDANVGPGDEILLTEMEHHSNLVPWQQLAERTGVRLRHIPITDDGLLDLETIDGPNGLLSERTKLVAVMSVSNVLGTINPIKEITDRAHEVGAVVLIDAAQSVPHMPTDVQALGADFLAFSGHKMLGPSGVGVLYGRQELLETMPAFLGGGSMIREVFLDRFTSADPPTKFEAGTPPIAQAIGLAAAVDYLETVGLDAIHQHEAALAKYAYEQLTAIEGVRILGPPPPDRAGMVTFVLEHESFMRGHIHAHDVAQELDRHGIAVRPGHHCAMPLHTRLGISASTRASFYLYNRPEEVDALVVGLESVKKRFHRGHKRKRQ